MSVDFGAGDATAGRFDSLYAEAKSVLGYAANQLRALTAAYREAYAGDLASWHRERDDLDAAKRLDLDDLAAPSEAGPGARAATRSPEAGRPGIDEAGAEAEADDARRGLLGRDVAVGLDLLGDRAAELGRLELAIRTMERAWLFLERGDESLLADPDAPEMPGDLQMRIVQAREAERSLLAQEVHDGPAQALANAALQVEYIDKVLDREPGAVRTELRLMRERLRRELVDVRAYISQLRPPLLEELGLNGSIDDAVATVASLTGSHVEAHLEAPPDLLSDAEQVVALRVLQEALQNIRKHAAARTAQVTTRMQDDAWVLEVRDDGRGFDPDTIAALGRRNFGMQFMRERAALVGARFEVRSRPSGGTVVWLAIPIGEERRLRR